MKQCTISIHKDGKKLAESKKFSNVLEFMLKCEEILNDLLEEHPELKSLTYDSSVTMHANLYEDGVFVRSEVAAKGFYEIMVA